jgi:sugar phosphate isomerase/epimerase
MIACEPFPFKRIRAVQREMSRRQWLGGVSAGGIAGLAALPAQADQPTSSADPFRYCLNTSTIQGQRLSLTEEVNLAARAGYQGIEPWIRELERFVQQGGNLRDLGRRIRDAGLRVEDAIGFSEWIVDDDARRRRALEQARREMDLVRQVGGTRIAAPPAGATNAEMPLERIVERYRALLELGEREGVTPQLELWGFSRTLSRLSQCAYVAIQAGHPRACILADVYHLYKGGSGFASIHLLGGEGLHVLHMNDYPAQPPREQITDAQRIYPGDGVAPLRTFLRDLRRAGFRGALSLELFNREYWTQDALTVARTGLEKMRAAVRSSLSD